MPPIERASCGPQREHDFAAELCLPARGSRDLDHLRPMRREMRRRTVERPDRALAAGEGARFVTVERHGAIKRTVIQGLHGKAIGACASHAPHIDLRAGDPARHFETVPAGLRPCNGARQGGDPVREFGIRPAVRLKPCRTALRDERALPSGVFGPRLRRPFLRLALRLASLIIPAPNPWRTNASKTCG